MGKTMPSARQLLVDFGSALLLNTLDNDKAVRDMAITKGLDETIQALLEAVLEIVGEDEVLIPAEALAGDVLALAGERTKAGRNILKVQLRKDLTTFFLGEGNQNK